MTDTSHDIAVQVAEDKREREGCEVGSCVAPLTVGACVSPLTVGVGRLDAYRTNTAGADTNSLAEPTAECYVTQAKRLINPLRTEADWQQAERVIALLAEKVADRSNCPRIWDGESADCPATDYCIDHYPDSLPCEDGTCPAVIAAWAREKEDK